MLFEVCQLALKLQQPKINAPARQRSEGEQKEERNRSKPRGGGLHKSAFDETQQVNKHQSPNHGEDQLPSKGVGSDSEFSKSELRDQGTGDANDHVAHRTEAAAFCDDAANPSRQGANHESGEKRLNRHDRADRSLFRRFRWCGVGNLRQQIQEAFGQNLVFLGRLLVPGTAFKDLLGQLDADNIDAFISDE